MKVAIMDGLRHTNLSGYGMLCRSIIFGFDDLGHDVYVHPHGDRQWGKIEAGARDRLEALPELASFDEVDLVLHIGTPNSVRSYPKPTVIYTQNALGDLTEEWVDALDEVDACIVPSEFDRRVFERYLERVYVAQQSSDSLLFRPRPAWKEQGAETGLFTFLFVGSYSFRKGIDLLLEAFLAEFDAEEKVELLIQAPDAGTGVFNHLLSYIQRINPTGRIRLQGNSLSPEWMCRLYNESQCMVTLSRGEGWGMPITEALLCETPVIAPDSTAMGEYLNDDIAYLVPVREREISKIEDPFGAGFVEVYGKPGNTCFDPDVAVAREQMRAVFEDYETAKSKAARGREVIERDVSWRNAVEDIERACMDFLESREPREPAET
jgi:glycosyltransferase involved in cell wall biosynthesis